MSITIDYDKVTKLTITKLCLAADYYANISPSLARFYMKKLDLLKAENEMPATPELTRCKFCGTPFRAYNFKTDIIRRKKDKNYKQKITCYFCDKRSIINLTGKRIKIKALDSDKTDIPIKKKSKKRKKSKKPEDSDNQTLLRKLEIESKQKRKQERRQQSKKLSNLNEIKNDDVGDDCSQEASSGNSAETKVDNKSTSLENVALGSIAGSTSSSKYDSKKNNIEKPSLANETASKKQAVSSNNSSSKTQESKSTLQVKRQSAKMRQGAVLKNLLKKQATQKDTPRSSGLASFLSSL